MVFEIVLSILIILFTSFYYNKVYLTKKKMQNYKRLFEEAGYKVKLLDYKLLGGKALDNLMESEKKYSNPTHYNQHELSKYDVQISSLNMQPIIQLVNLDLIQAYFNSNSYNYRKYEPIIANLRRVIGSGIAFSEGSDWKKKRKIVSNAFHFQFLHSLIPKMIKTLDEYFDEFDGNCKNRKVVLLDMFQHILASFMVKFFFGSDLGDQTLDGMTIPKLMNKVIF